MNILNFGSCNIDRVYSLDHIVLSGETETTAKLEIFPGGKGLNQSIAIARAGSKVFHAGCIGLGGEFLLEILQENGVDTRYILNAEKDNGHAIIQVTKSGENSILLFPGSNECVTKEQIDEVLKNFTRGDILLLQNEISNVDYLIDAGYRRGMRIILNPSPFNEKIAPADYEKLSYLILNEVEAMQITNIDTPEEALPALAEKYPTLGIMLTLGSHGCIFKNYDIEIRHPAFMVEAVDTTAAGDTFTGYFVSGLSEGLEISDILKRASLASAISVTRRGAAPSIPTREETEAMLDKIPEIERGQSSALKNKIDCYIDENLRDATLTALSELLGYSPSHTGKIIKALTGKTFTELLHSRRVKKAAKLLSETSLGISAIISTVGYNNESYFRRIFKEKLGKNPLEFRKSKN